MSWDIISKFLFPAPRSSYDAESFGSELIFVPKNLELRARCPPSQCVPCLFLPKPSARFLILYLHSNAEDLGTCYGFCRILREQLQVHVLAVEYPGYGLCPGGPATADNVTENAFAVFRFVREILRWPLDSVKIFGRSIGTGPAISLAVQYKVAGVILIAPFLSIKELLNGLVGPLSYLVDERFPNKDRVHLIRSPVLIIHGQKDSLIPHTHGVSLYELCRSRKLLVCPEDMEHNTNLLVDTGFLVLPMLQFFSLPDYCFEEIEVPDWAYDRRLAVQPLEARPSPLPTPRGGAGASPAGSCRSAATAACSPELSASSPRSPERPGSQREAPTPIKGDATVPDAPRPLFLAAVSSERPQTPGSCEPQSPAYPPIYQLSF